MKTRIVHGQDYVEAEGNEGFVSWAIDSFNELRRCIAEKVKNELAAENKRQLWGELEKIENERLKLKRRAEVIRVTLGIRS